jgi:hypothetical protein
MSPAFRVTPVHDLLLRGSELLPVGLFQLQLATAEQLTRLHYSPTSLKLIQKRMRVLAESGYVQVDATPIKHHSGTKTFFSPLYYYTLGAKGMRYLQGLGLDTHEAWRAHKELDRHALFIDHTLELNDVLIAASLIHKADPGFHLDQFQHERVLKRQPVKVTWADHGHSATYAVIPDAFLDFRRTGTSMSLRVLLEHDRGTEEQQHFKRKIRAYIVALQGGAFTQRFGAGAFTVAFTTFVGEQRVKQMREWTEQVLEDAKAEWELGTAFNFAALSRSVTPEQAWLEARWRLAYAKSPQKFSLLAS